MTVGSSTAALILSLHPEYGRSMIRGGRREATKENGEFRIPLWALVDFMLLGVKMPISPSADRPRIRNVADLGLLVWPHRDPLTGEGRA